MAQRTQSPSSINVYNQCPRRYFYQYILKLATKPSIHLVRGNIAHKVLEDFYKLKIENVDEKSYEFVLRLLILDMLNQEWVKAKSKFDELDLSEHDLKFYYNETKSMIERYIENFIIKLKFEMESKSFEDAFKHLTPITEKHYKSEKHMVRGYIDAIYEWGDNVQILDYKTSKKDTMSAAYRLQLGIYALLYLHEHGIKPKRVGINFLKFGEKYIEVNDNLIKEAEDMCFEIQEKTKTEDIKDYCKKITPLCKWSTGQCDFYEQCCKDE